METERPADEDDPVLATLALPGPRRAAIGDRLEAAARSRRGRRRWLQAAAGAGGLAAAALLLMAVPHRPPDDGTHLRTGAGDFQLLPLGDRGVAFVSEQTDLDLRLERTPTLRLHRGSVRLVIRRHQGQPFVVVTSAAEVEVLGTEFDVTAGPLGTEVRVVRGEVEVRNPQGRRRLWARESARVRPGEAPRMAVPTAAVIVDGPAVIERGR
jgi:ferric-dicitrate binding protein FerR (iron transport regulator)